MMGVKCLGTSVIVLVTGLTSRECYLLEMVRAGERGRAHRRAWTGVLAALAAGAVGLLGGAGCRPCRACVWVWLCGPYTVGALGRWARPGARATRRHARRE